MSNVLIKDGFGLTTYLQYGGGPSHQNLDGVIEYKLQRAFVSNSVTTLADDRARFQPTHQNYKYDDYLNLCKANGIRMIYCTQGSFSYMNTTGSSGKSMPIADGDDPKDLASWAEVAKLCKQIAIRYAADSAASLGDANVYQDATYLSNTPLAGLDLIEAIEIQNEWNFKSSWSGALRTITPDEYAYCFMACYLAIREVSATIPIIMGGGIGGDITDMSGMLAEIEVICADLAIPVPTDFYLCFHWYMRFGTTNQTGGQYGISPEEALAIDLANQVDALCTTYSLPGWYCTETGWATDSSKQSAPVQEGYTREESQGILMIRLMLIWGSVPSFKGVSFWHCRDDYDSPPYAKGGINYRNWSAKPARTICAAFKDVYDDYWVTDFYKTGDIYYAVLDNGVDSVILNWTDGVNNGTVTPMPTVVGFAPPPDPDPDPIVAEVVSIKYLDSATKELIGLVENFSEFVVTEVTTTIEALVQNGDSVSFVLTGPVSETRIESASPYVLFGNAGSLYNGSVLPVGTYSLLVEPRNVTYGPGIPINLTFTVVESPTVTPGPAPTVDATLQGTALVGEDVTLSWVTTNASAVNITGLIGDYAPNDSVVLSFPKAGSYNITLTAIGTDPLSVPNQVSKTVTILVSDPAPLPPTPTSPSISASLSASEVVVGSSVTLTWNTTNASGVTIGGVGGTFGTSGSISKTFATVGASSIVVTAIGSDPGADPNTAFVSLPLTVIEEPDTPCVFEDVFITPSAVSRVVIEDKTTCKRYIIVMNKQ